IYPIRTLTRPPPISTLFPYTTLFRSSKRIAFISWVWPELRGETAQARRHKQREEDKVKAHRVEHATYRFWDHWLSDGRVPHLFRSEEHTSELQSRENLVCRPLLEKKY